MEPRLLKFSVPPGSLLGWKVVTTSRYPIYYKFQIDKANASGNNLRMKKYLPGTVHTARVGGFYHFSKNYLRGEFKTAKELKAIRNSYTNKMCLPGIHLFTNFQLAVNWRSSNETIIPVSYSPKSIVSEKGNPIVVFRLKVLG